MHCPRRWGPFLLVTGTVLLGTAWLPMSHSVLLSSRESNTFSRHHSQLEVCSTGNLGAHICDRKSKERLDHKPIPVPDFHHLLAFLSPLDRPTHMWKHLPLPPLPFLLPTPIELYLCQTQRPSRGCPSRGQSGSPFWGEPSWKAQCLHRARTSPNSSADLKVSELMKVLLCLQVLCFLGASYQVPLCFYVINHFFQSWVLSRSRECTLLWPWFLPLLLKWDQCWLSCLFQITKVIQPFSGCIRPISSHSFLAGNSACTGDFDPGQLNTSLKYITW